VCLGFLSGCCKDCTRRSRPRLAACHVRWAERHESLVRDPGEPYFSPHSLPIAPGIPDPKRL